MRVLVTRPEPDAERLGQALREKGHEPVLCPLMTIEPTADPPPAWIAEATLVFTSANGVRAALGHGIRSAKGVLAIGPATAAAALQAGFSVAGVAQGDIVSLARLARDHLPTDQPVVHVAGADLAGDLKGALEHAGFNAVRWRAYRARAAGRLPDGVITFLHGPPGAVALFSPRSARLLIELMGQAAASDLATRHTALCLSAAVAQAASGAPWRRRLIAARPDQGALVRLLD